MNPLIKALDGASCISENYENHLFGDDVNSNYIIFFTGRCGSTLLTSILRDSKRNGNPEEFLNEEYIKYWKGEHPGAGTEDFMRDVRRRGTLGGFFGLEIDPMRFNWLLEWGGVSEQSAFSKARGSIWLIRSDIVAQAFSYAIAKRSGVWHSFSAAPPVANSSAEIVSDAEVWVELLSIMCAEDWMERVFARNSVTPLRISYEELVTDRVATVGRVLSEINGGEFPSDYISGIVAASDGVKKLVYSGKDRAYIDFWSRNRSLLTKVLNFRASRSAPEEAIDVVLKGRQDVDGLLIRRIRKN